ncbi:Glycogenin-1 [Achaetomium macrosporum]|uniref:glycogenin glucosyltransferase n=1 Tax=Achaetomium macrosporum TaxID=79813 RepID=A0AAN7CFR7_9PEZI|nr:Glycogenin-1 [Achaetomium macrosporum]
MAGQGGEDVYASLLLTDTYLPGALVLAHSLRDAGTTKKLAILVTLDTVSANVVTQLKASSLGNSPAHLVCTTDNSTQAVYDYVIPVSRIQNEHAADLDLMNRPDLHSAFTKINLWRQTQFRKIVYVDADIVAYRAPDELFDLDHAFSAAPDIGWPDLFNTGLMVLTPNMGDYYALMAMAQRGISFDGADQGLLNMYFKNNFHRLSFTYNVTPSAHYQYIPAYRHFQSSISMVHFIGPDKPWIQGRERTAGGSPFDQMAGRWWAVYDRHYRKEAQPEDRAPEIVQYFVKGEFQPTISYVVPVGEPSSDESSNVHGQQYQPTPAASHAAHHHHRHHHLHQQHHHAPPEPLHGGSSVERPLQPEEGTRTEAPEDQGMDRQQWNAQQPLQSEQKPQPQPQPEMAPSWDAQRHPPPPDSKPEAMNFPQTQYEMSSDPAPFVPPVRYPSPPKNMWYEVPKEPPAHLHERPKPIFPWETHKPQPTRVFPHSERSEPAVAEPAPASPEKPTTSTESHDFAASDVPETQPVAQTSEPQAPPGPTSRTALSAPSDIWSSFPRTNAWDTVPEINRYVDTLQKHRRTRSRNLALGGGKTSPEGLDFGWSRRGSKVTDFPGEDERPSLPVTPAPIRRPRRWGSGGRGAGFGGGAGGEEQLPAAEGVPAQSDWDPAAQLQKLAREQSEVLLQRLGGGMDQAEREIPSRPLPFGSEDVRSPTYVAPRVPVVSPKPVKPHTAASPVNKILEAAPDIVPSWQVATTFTAPRDAASGIQAPSYQGPGPAFEKGEDIPTHETPALPTEEEQDILET